MHMELTSFYFLLTQLQAEACDSMHKLPAPAATSGAASPPVKPIKAPPPMVANAIRPYRFNLRLRAIFKRVASSSLKKYHSKSKLNV